MLASAQQWFRDINDANNIIVTRENSNLASISVTALKRRMSGGSGGGGGRRLSIPLSDREHALHDKDIDDTLHDTSLLRTQMKLVEKKDFTNEARFPQLGRKSLNLRPFFSSS